MVWAIKFEFYFDQKYEKEDLERILKISER